MITIVRSALVDTLDRDEYNDFCGGNADFGEVMKNIAYARKRFAEAIKTENGFRVYRLLLHDSYSSKLSLVPTTSRFLWR